MILQTLCWKWGNFSGWEVKNWPINMNTFSIPSTQPTDRVRLKNCLTGCTAHKVNKGSVSMLMMNTIDSPNALKYSPEYMYVQNEMWNTCRRWNQIANYDFFSSFVYCFHIPHSFHDIATKWEKKKEKIKRKKYQFRCLVIICFNVFVTETVQSHRLLWTEKSATFPMILDTRNI